MRLKFVRYKDIFDPEKVITNSNPVKDKKFTEDGVFSESIFGPIQDNDNIDIIGWIDFGDCKIINPILFDRMKKIFGNSTLNKLISYNRRTDKDGNIIEIEEKGKPIEDAYIGIPKFIERFEELLEKYGNKERKEYKTIKKEYEDDNLFINCIPVFSSKLRPATIINDSLVYDEINIPYNFIIEYAEKINELNENEDLMRNPLIYQLQIYCNTLTQKIINDHLKGKKGIFRKYIVSTRVNFSARNVIIPAPDGRMCEVHIPYRIFMELYRCLLLNIISTAEGINYYKANKFLDDNINVFNPKIYRYMNELLNKSKGKLKILLNRNPTINIGSILLLDIGSIKKDPNDLTLSLSNSILPSLNADFDGDVLNIIALFTTSDKKAFKNLSPKNLIISKNDGKFNKDFSLAKDQRLGIYILNN